MRRFLLGLVLWLGAGSGTGCASHAFTASTPADVARVRAHARGSTDPETLGRWLLAEMFAPGGGPAGAREARSRIEQAGARGVEASLAAGIFDETHGEPQKAALAYVDAIDFARSGGTYAALSAWFAANHLQGLRGAIPNLWERERRRVFDLVAHPGRMGWRALAELNDWVNAQESAAPPSEDSEEALISRVGCAPNVRVAGPFGHGVAADRRIHFAAESAPWPAAWDKDSVRGTVPRVLRTERHRCTTASAEPTQEGVFYAETFFHAKTDLDAIIAVQGALEVRVDDVAVLERDLGEWGIWQRFGVAVHVPPGRHRIVARLLGNATSVRVLHLDGTPARVVTDANGSLPYSVGHVTVLESPNPIEAVVDGLRRQTPVRDPLRAILSAHAAYVDGLSDVAGALIEPFTKQDAAPEALLYAALFVHTDPAYPDQLRHTSEKDFYERAAKTDPGLWQARGWLSLDDADQRGGVEAVEPLVQLALASPKVPQLRAQLARLYGRLGWRGERARTLREAAKTFPADREVLGLFLTALEEDGDLSEADRVAAQVKKADPDSDIDVERAIARRDWSSALRELARLEQRRPERTNVSRRVAEVLLRSGDPSAAARELERDAAKSPEDEALALRVADGAYARGDLGALRRMLTSVLRAGAKGADLREAVELVEGASALEAYRVSGQDAIRQFEKWERAGKRMEGTAARVLDYAATWVHPDGSSEMLEHEILRIQSQEAVQKEAEQAQPEGRVLRLRVLKPGGAVLEPDRVAGKPTLTLPNLEVGDYVEVEHITSTPSDGTNGNHYRGPSWFFREPDKGYWRSEFVLVTPSDKALEVETIGAVPAPHVAPRGAFVERRWRVDESPAAPEEPESPSPREFLPSVRVGWGFSLEDMLRRYVEAASDMPPLDPRLRAMAMEIVRAIPASQVDDRARAVYDFATSQIQEGNEGDGRRAFMGHSGSRQACFLYLLRLLGIRSDLAVVKSRTAMPAVGKLSEVEVYDHLAVRIHTERGPRWLTVQDKFAPYGYMPAELRGQPSILLTAGAPREVTPSLGSADGVRIEGTVTLRPDGSASLELSQSYGGRMGIGLRTILARIADKRRDELVETRLLAPNIPGAHLRQVAIENVSDLSKPLVFRITAEAPDLARAVGSRRVLRALFPVHLAQVAALPERKTPLLLGASSHVEVHLRVVAPSASAWAEPPLPRELSNDGRSVRVADTLDGATFTLSRTVDLPAGRIQPGPDYAEFVGFAREADALFEREVPLGQTR